MIKLPGRVKLRCAGLSARPMKDLDILDFDRRLALAAQSSIDPLDLSRRIELAARSLGRWWQALSDGPDASAAELAISTKVSGLTIFGELADQLQGDPLYQPLRRWVYRLAEQRINAEAIFFVACHYRVEQKPHLGATRQSLALRRMITLALTRVDERQEWLEHYFAHAESFAAATRQLFERKAEVARRMGVSEPFALLDGHDDLTEFAQRWLEATDDMVTSLRGLPLARWLDAALASGGPAVWPRVLSTRRLLDAFRGGPLTEDVRLRSLDLPEPLAPASFLRGLDRLGLGYVEALGPADQPFVIAHDPYRLSGHVVGAAFGSLPWSRPYAKRVLDVAPHRMSDHRRVLGQAVLLESRVRALRVVLRAAAYRGAMDFCEAFQEWTHRCFGFDLSPKLAGALFTPADECGQQFAGLLLGHERAARFVAEHDEDWFRSPRAQERWRAECSMPPTTQVEQAAFDAGFEGLNQELLEALG